MSSSTASDDVNETYPEFYFSTTCHVCKLKCKELKCCKSCRVYRYCSRQHQIVDWPRHKTICNVLHKFIKKSSLENCFSLTDDGWLFSKMKIKMLLENELNRPLTPAENQLWMFPRACAVCYETNIQDLFDCPNCPSASYCSAQHQVLHQDKHNKICKQMQLQYMFYCDKMKGEEKIRLYKLYETFEDTTKIFTHNFNEVNETTLRKLQQGDKLSHLLTIFNAFNVCELINQNSFHFGNGSKNSLIVHVVGATYDWSNFDGYIIELITHWIHNLERLNIVFIGPELSTSKMDQWTKCDQCNKRNVITSLEYQPLLYEEYFYSDKYKIPNVVCIFNCGFHETENTEDDLWNDSLPLLFSPNAPLIFTSYTESEAVKDFNRIISHTSSSNLISIYKKHEKNIYRSPLALRDWMEPDEVYYNNNFYSVLMKKEG